jgi:hypothetical protein
MWPPDHGTGALLQVEPNGRLKIEKLRCQPEPVKNFRTYLVAAIPIVQECAAMQETTDHTETAVTWASGGIGAV